MGIFFLLWPREVANCGKTFEEGGQFLKEPPDMFTVYLLKYRMYSLLLPCEGSAIILVRDGADPSPRITELNVSFSNCDGDFHRKHDQLRNRKSPFMGMEAVIGPGCITSYHNDSGRPTTS